MGTRVRGSEPVTQCVGLEAPRRKVRLQNRHWDLLFFVGTTAVATLVAEPYLHSWAGTNFGAIQVQSDELSGAPKFSYVWQFIGSTPYLFELKSLVSWGLGFPFGLVALLGWWRAILELVFSIIDWLRGRRRRLTRGTTSGEVVDIGMPVPTNPQSPIPNPQSIALLVVWPTLYFLYVGTWQARFIRHLMPLVPFCCLFVGGMVARLHTAAGSPSLRKANLWAGWALGGVALVGGITWGLSVTAIYTTLDTRLAATAWFRENVPAGTRLVIEDNHRPLVPIPDEAHPKEIYNYNTLKVTDPDTPQKMADFAGSLATGDLLIVPDRRWSAVLPRIPGFPLTGNYYSLLFSGKLGYTPVITFTDPPRLGPFAWSDDDAEETFQVFDHPTVKVFRNTGKLSEAELRRLLGAGP